MAASWGQREKQREKEDTGNCQGYGSGKDGKNGGKVLPVISNYVLAGGGQVRWNSLDLQ